jgi:hypothetical protein
MHTMKIEYINKHIYLVCLHIFTRIWSIKLKKVWLNTILELYFLVTDVIGLNKEV